MPKFCIYSAKIYLKIKIFNPFSISTAQNLHLAKTYGFTTRDSLGLNDFMEFDEKELIDACHEILKMEKKECKKILTKVNPKQKSLVLDRKRDHIDTGCSTRSFLIRQLISDPEISLSLLNIQRTGMQIITFSLKDVKQIFYIKHLRLYDWLKFNSIRIVH